MVSNAIAFEQIDWAEIAKSLKNEGSEKLEQRLRKLEQKSPRRTVTIEDVDPMNVLEAELTKKSTR